MQRIFISSVQKELAPERRALKEYIQGDALLRRFFEVFLFEDLPALDRRADEVYLDQVDHCSIYLGLLGNEYGFEDAQGVSPTEHEFDRATAQGKTRLIYVKGSDDKTRHPKMLALVGKAGGQVIRRRFIGIADLTSALNASLVDHLVAAGGIQTRPFEEQPCPDATLDALDPSTVSAFVRRAREERQFPLAETTAVADVMTHLDLLLDGQPTKAAVLLFGRNPQRYFPSAEVRCMHFHGTEIARPVPYYRMFKGNLFDQVDQAVDFALSKLNRSVGTRAGSPQADVHYELPKQVVAEAIVNAVAHRDYASGAAVQVSVFADRVEVSNPGELPAPLTLERLRLPHNSIARNHRICEALFLARYIEKFGTGTLMMIRESVAHGLPEPQFEQRPGEFAIKVSRDWLTDSVISSLNFNERQRKAITFARREGRITNAIYQKVVGGSRRTALRELDALAHLGVLDPRGKGRGAHYILGQQKRAINAPNAPQASPVPRRLQTSQGGQGAKPSASARSAKHATIAPNAPDRKRDIKGTKGTCGGKLPTATGAAAPKTSGSRDKRDLPSNPPGGRRVPKGPKRK